MKKIISLVAISFSLACGVSPQDAAEGLEYMSAHIEEDCAGMSHKHDPSVDVYSDDVQKAQFLPDGFGFTDSYGCFQEPWDGGFCYLPRQVLNIYTRLYQDGQDNTWFSTMSQEFGQWRDQLNATQNWTVYKWQQGNPTPRVEIHTSMDSGPGFLGGAESSGYVITSGAPWGQYASWNLCKVYLYRARIEANWAYAAANSTQRNRWLKNLWHHELLHCSGLPHTEGTANTLMSVDYGFPGPWFNSNLNPTAEEIGMLTAFDPIN